MKRRVLVSTARELLRIVLRFDLPADVVISRYFRAHPQLGQRDRHVLAESIYQIVRNLRLYRHLAQGASGAQDLHLLVLGWQGDAHGQLDEAFPAELLAWREGILRFDLSTLPPELRYSQPDWMAQALQARGDLDGGEFEALAQSLLQPAPLDLRVNLLKTTREAALAELRSLGIASETMRYSPWGLRVQGKPALNRSTLFTEGAIEVQDEGSQLLALLLAPRRGEMVADFCAGAGGKTLALGAMMRNTGRLYAFDVAEHRLDKLRPRLARSGLSNVYPVVIAHERDDRIQRLAGKLDRVLVDAPCTGTGTLRRNPDLKWRLNEADVSKLAAQQASILKSAATLLKPGGRLVYATCSLLPAENWKIVAQFLRERADFTLHNAAETLAHQQVSFEPATDNLMLELLPHRHGTDGFFAAVMQRA
ncbi:putative RIBOSOMAL RNA SMALL SUBUNIT METHYLTRANSFERASE B (SUN) [Thiomonas sp. X19]|uniref:RsmB/NOP family class I SAM-dependent RNA methyltransferase n=1 Tax=Thiomonas sp. X19 TaxID=1050370 RepID=UPI000B70EF4E|nr:RsmB/NOP family class I SAM-dependent RNA methyltransferase [Thiomonas sp. X19]SCC92850.1 putative RIBOSOMAL RNA SMALL SUBUNIT METHYLTRANSFERASE B (SUN) [Thiomonas sp. X19]